MYLRYDKLEKNALDKGHYLYANKCREFKMRHVIKYVENVDKNNEDNKLYNELYKEIRKFK